MTELFEHGYAIVIGVDDNNIKRLKLESVAKDVQAIHDVLVHPERCAYKAENVKLIKGAESTKANILDALYWLQEKVEADKDATAVIYYSGHGMVDKATNQYFLIPYDIKALTTCPRRCDQSGNDDGRNCQHQGRADVSRPRLLPRGWDGHQKYRFRGD